MVQCSNWFTLTFRLKRATPLNVLLLNHGRKQTNNLGNYIDSDGVLCCLWYTIMPAMPCQPPQFSGVIIYLALKQKNNKNGVEQEDIRVIAIFSEWWYILTHSTIHCGVWSVCTLYNLQSTCDEWEMRLCRKDVKQSGAEYTFYFLW